MFDVVKIVLHFLNGKRYGIDPLAESYKNLYKYPEDIHIQKAEGEYIPFLDEFFDRGGRKLELS